MSNEQPQTPLPPTAPVPNSASLDPMNKSKPGDMRPMQERIAKDGLQILHHIFRLENRSSPPPELADVVLIAIDFENVGTIKSGFCHRDDCQVGLAVLDTKEMNKIPPEKFVSTYNFATGPAQYITKASRKFMFGETMTIVPSDIVTRIQSIIPPDRNIVFVGHGITSDLLALQALRFPFPARLSAILDTFQVAKEVFQFSPGSLGDLLLELGCDFNRLHSAGNDANFTLRALLLLAARGFTGRFTGQERDQAARSTVTTLKQISSSPLPRWVDPEVQPTARRDERGEKSQKQEKGRAARRPKRQAIVPRWRKQTFAGGMVMNWWIEWGRGIDLMLSALSAILCKGEKLNTGLEKAHTHLLMSHALRSH